MNLFQKLNSFNLSIDKCRVVHNETLLVRGFTGLVKWFTSEVVYSYPSSEPSVVVDPARFMQYAGWVHIHFSLKLVYFFFKSFNKLIKINIFQAENLSFRSSLQSLPLWVTL